MELHRLPDRARLVEFLFLRFEVRDNLRGIFVVRESKCSVAGGPGDGPAAGLEENLRACPREEEVQAEDVARLGDIPPRESLDLLPRRGAHEVVSSVHGRKPVTVEQAPFDDRQLRFSFTAAARELDLRRDVATAPGLELDLPTLRGLGLLGGVESPDANPDGLK